MLQFTVAGVLGVVLTIFAHRWRLARATPPLQPSLDVGQSVHVTTWNADGSARVAYRGSDWNAELAAPDVPRGETMYIVATRGSVLVLSDSQARRHEQRAFGGLHHVARVVVVHRLAVRRSP